MQSDGGRAENKSRTARISSKSREKNCRAVDEGGEFRQTETGYVQEYMVEDKQSIRVDNKKRVWKEKNPCV